MAGLLWDLDKVTLRMAVAMWRQQADRAATASIAKRRTKEAFLDQKDACQREWLGYAEAALDALFVGDEA